MLKAGTLTELLSEGKVLVYHYHHAVLCIITIVLYKASGSDKWFMQGKHTGRLAATSPTCPKLFDRGL